MSNSKKKRKIRKLAIETLESRRVMATLPYGAEPDDTGEFMLGRIAVTPVFLESDGSIDASTENWTTGHINQVLNNIQTGLNWWNRLLATKSSVHTLEWVIDTTYTTNITPTPYEPIARNSNAYSLWVSEFLSDVGFSSSSVLEENIRAFNNSQREKLDTDWSFTIFVVNSQNDGDGSFAPGGSFSRAFAFAGGLFEVVPSTRPASTFTHETGHMFWARDEYSGGGNYFQRRGYYNAQNTNALDLNPTPNFQQALSIMSAGSNLQTAFDTTVSAEATLAQIGWKDSDQDGIFDVLDVPLLLEGTGRYNPSSNSYRFVGRSSVQTLPNLNTSGTQNDITLNKIGRVEYRIGNGPWITISTPNTYTTALDLNIPLSVSQGQIQIRTTDPRIGITSNVFTGQIGAIPDTTTQAGIQGFVWNDANGNSTWESSEIGQAGISVSIVDINNQPVNLQTVVEPDNLPTGMYNNTVPGVRIDVIGDDASGVIGVFPESTNSNGSKIFKPYSFSAGNYVEAFRGTSQQFRARFNNPTTYVSIDATAVGDNTDVRLDALAADGTVIKRFERKGMLAGQKVTMEVGVDTAIIASIVARGFDGSFVKLDNFRFGPKTSATTASDGSYVLPYLPAGSHRLRSQSSIPGFEFTNPSSGIQTVFLAAASIVTHADFGVKRVPSPWQNPTINEDVNNLGTVDPIDVLILINEINRNGSRPLDGSGLTAPPYLDVNGDRNLGPLDVLQVINYINSRGRSGNGEGETLLTSVFDASPSPSSAVPFTSFVMDLQAALPTTWIIESSTTRGRREVTGPDRCGCPACCSFSSEGEASASIVDIAQATKIGAASSKPLASPASLASPADGQPFETLDDFLKAWIPV